MEKEKESRPLTEEGREQMLIDLALNLVEERLRNGTASSQETTHFLKLGSSKERLEQALLRENVELARAKTENLKILSDMENIAQEAMNAFMSYRSSND